LIESTYEYNPHGELLAAQNAFADVTRDYDDAGRLLSEEINGQGVNHRYDEQGRLVGTTFEEGVEFRLEYQGDSVAVRDASGAWHAWHPDAPRVWQRNLASGLRERFRYGDGDRLLDYVLDRGGGDGDALLDYRVTYDVLGRPTQLEQDGRPVRLTCDRCGRLLRVVETLPGREQEQERFTYDPASNPLDARLAPAPSIGRANRLMNWGDRDLSYDERGRLAAERLRGDLRTFSYDSADQLISVQLPGGPTVRYEYDPLRRRVAKRVGE